MAAPSRLPRRVALLSWGATMSAILAAAATIWTQKAVGAAYSAKWNNINRPRIMRECFLLPKCIACGDPRCSPPGLTRFTGLKRGQ